MRDEKTAFSERLRAAMRAQQLAPKAAVLEKLFNTNYNGQSVTIQSVAAWLGGRSIPKSDKLRVLADVLGVEPQHLQFGGKASSRVGETAGAWRDVSPQDRALIDALLVLPPARRKLIGELIKALMPPAGK
jgi:hypothetical protein